MEGHKMKKVIFLGFITLVNVSLFAQTIIGNQIRYSESRGSGSSSVFNIENIRTNVLLNFRIDHKGANYYGITIYRDGLLSISNVNYDLYSSEFTDVLKDNIISAGGGRDNDPIWSQYASQIANRMVQHVRSYHREPNVPSPPPATAVVFPFEGRWIVSGKDRYDWTAFLIIEKINGYEFSGYFEWYRGIDYAGTEYYRGEYDSQRKTVVLRGYHLYSPKNMIGMGIYGAYLARNGYDLEAGTWRGPGTVEGTWEAKWHE